MGTTFKAPDSIGTCCGTTCDKQEMEKYLKALGAHEFFRRVVDDYIKGDTPLSHVLHRYFEDLGVDINRDKGRWY
jgi:hypothetical protein